MSALVNLQSSKASADKVEADRDNYAAYIESMREYGWTEEDVSEYRVEIERIMKSGTDEEKRAASEFWTAETDHIRIAKGINNRIRASLAQKNRKTA